MSQRPFERPPYASLPERPRRPHPYFELPAENLALDSSTFGRMNVHVRRMGRGPKLVCVHGLMTSSYSFRYLFEPLSKHFEVIAFDLPGAGRSEAPDAPHTPEALARFLGEVLVALDAEGARIIGNSMGGYLSMQLALERPELVGRLVNLHSPGVPTPRMHALEGATALPGARALLSALVARDPERWAFENVHYYDESLKSLEEAREYAAPLHTDAGRRAFFRYLSEALSARAMRGFVARLERLGGRFPVPLQLVYAERDPMVPPEVGRVLGRLLPESELVWLAEGSHFAHVDATERFVASALPFLLEGGAR